jgi:hypothetical protein
LELRSDCWGHRQQDKTPILHGSIRTGLRRNTPHSFFPSELKPHTSCSESSTLAVPVLGRSAVGAMGEFCGDFSQPANWIVLTLYADLGQSNWAQSRSGFSLCSETSPHPPPFEWCGSAGKYPHLFPPIAPPFFGFYHPKTYPSLLAIGSAGDRSRSLVSAAHPAIRAMRLAVLEPIFVSTKNGVRERLGRFLWPVLGCRVIRGGYVKGNSFPLG